MRDLLFKNITSSEKGRKIIATSEVSDSNGVHCVVRRHFIYLVKEVDSQETGENEAPLVYLKKERNSVQQKDMFFCKIKGKMYTVWEDKLLLINFIHSLRVDLSVTAKQGKEILA